MLKMSVFFSLTLFIYSPLGEAVFHIPATPEVQLVGIFENISSVVALTIWTVLLWDLFSLVPDDILCPAESSLISVDLSPDHWLQWLFLALILGEGEITWTFSNTEVTGLYWLALAFISGSMFANHVKCPYAHTELWANDSSMQGKLLDQSGTLLYYFIFILVFRQLLSSKVASIHNF